MKHFFLVVIFVLSFFYFLPSSFAACAEVRGTSNVGDIFSSTDNCFTDSKTNKTYSVTTSSFQGTTEAPDIGNTDNLLGFSWEKIRSGDFDMDDIPNAIVNIIEFLLGVAGTISVVALIYHAVQMQINSGITGDSSGVDKAKAGMKWAMLGFIVSMLAWFIVARVVDIFTSISQN